MVATMEYILNTPVVFIQSQSGAGKNFDGVAPAEAFVFAGGQFVWPNNTVHAGLFDFDALGVKSAIRIKSVYFRVSGQTTWSMVIVNPNSTTIPLLSGTTAAVDAVSVLDALLQPGQKLRIITTGAGTSVVFASVLSIELVEPDYATISSDLEAVTVSAAGAYDYTPSTLARWGGAAPTKIATAIDRIAAVVGASVPIP